MDSGSNYLFRTRDRFAGQYIYIYKSGAHCLEAGFDPLTKEKLDLYRRRSVEYEQFWHMPFKQLAVLTVDPCETNETSQSGEAYASFNSPSGHMLE